jgi:hypothetical protein
MTNRDWAALGIKLGVLWLFLTETIELARVPVQWMGHIEGHPGRVAVVVLAHVVPMAIAAYIWFRVDVLAAHVAPEESDTASVAGLDREGLLTVAMVVMGIWLISRAASTLTFYLTRAAATWQEGQTLLGPDRALMQKVWDVTAKASIADGVVTLLLGIGLVLGTERLSALFLRFRREMTGTQPETETEGSDDGKL